MNNNPTTLSKILSGINNTLNIANKVMPLYKEAKPIVETISKTYNNIKNNKNDITKILKYINKNNNNAVNSKPPKIIPNKNNNNPTFFI